MPWLKADPFYKTMQQIINLKPYNEIFTKLSDINLSYLSRLAYINTCLPGIDNRLVLDYWSKSKEIFGLDDMTYKDDEFNRLYDKSINAFVNVPFLMSLIISRFKK